jgi:hypothetical protein
MSDLRDDVRLLFRELTGREPDGVWSAPGLVTPPGASAPRAIDRRVLVAAGARDDDLLRVASAEAGEAAELRLATLPEAVGRSGWADVALAVVADLGADFAAVPGVDLVLESNVPIGVGLGSSDAVAGAVSTALRDLWRLAPAPAAHGDDTGGDAVAVAVETTGDARETALAADLLVEHGAGPVWPSRDGATVLGLLPADAVSRVRVALDGGFAEHGLPAPEPHVAGFGAAGALRES